MKRALKRAISSTLGAAFARDPGARVVVLCYHSVHDSLPFSSASPALFDAHLEWLSTACDVVALRDVLTVAVDASRRRPAVAITFDDGYEDNHAHALPALERWKAPASFFVTVGLVERDAAVVARMAALRRTSTADVAGLTWAQVEELVARGHEVGSHTWSHPLLAALPGDAVRDELTRSKAALEDRLGIPVSSLAYPFGKPGRHATAETAAIARAVGYERAAAVLFRGVRTDESPFMIPRFFPTQDDVATLAEKVLGRWDWLGEWQERAPRWLARRVSPADFRDLADDEA